MQRLTAVDEGTIKTNSFVYIILEGESEYGLLPYKLCSGRVMSYMDDGTIKIDIPGEYKPARPFHDGLYHLNAREVYTKRAVSLECAFRRLLASAEKHGDTPDINVVEFFLNRAEHLLEGESYPSYVDDVFTVYREYLELKRAAESGASI